MTLYELEKQFQYHFDDISGDIMISGITFSASDILKEMDPIAYRQEFLHYCDYMEIDIEELV